MGYSHSEVADAFLHGKRRWSEYCNMLTDGETIYSYGEHFPIAKRMGDGVYLFNVDRYSVSTSRHQSVVRWALRGQQVYECTTGEIKAARPGLPVVLTKVIQHDSLKGAMRNVADICSSRGMKPVPFEKWQTLIKKDFWLGLIRSKMRSYSASDRLSAVAMIRSRLDEDLALSLKLWRKLARDEDKDVRKEASNKVIGVCWRLNTRQIPHFEKRAPAMLADFDAEYMGSLHVRAGIDYSIVLLNKEDGPYAFIGATNHAYLPWAGGKTLKNMEMASSLQMILEDPARGVGPYTDDMKIVNRIHPGCSQVLPGLVVFNDL